MPALASRFDRALPAEPASVPVLRAALTTWAQELDLGAETLSAVRLTVTEAVTNAVLHAYVGRPPGDVRVLAETSRGQLLVRIIDEGNGLGPRHDSPGLGLGLPMMGRLATQVDLTAGPGGLGTEVRLAFHVAHLPGPEQVGEDLLDEVLDALARMSGDEGFEGRDIGVLGELLVPRVADLCSITLMDADGEVRRIGARVARPDGTFDAEATAWVLEFPVTAPAAPSARAARESAAQVVDVDDAWIRAVSPDEERAALLRDLGLAWWLAVPLLVGGRAVGSVSVAGRPGRGEPDDVLELVERAAARAGALVATAQLVDELRRTRRRFERILGALSEAVTVNGPDGRVVYANPAAATLLGMTSVEELLLTDPGDLADRFDITGEDGEPVPFDALPHRRLLDGKPAAPLVTRSVRRADGVVFWLRTSATMLDDDGPLVVNVLQDITAERT